MIPGMIIDKMADEMDFGDELKDGEDKDSE